jgi:hypothetical protein
MTAASNKGMKQTSVEHIGRSQLNPQCSTDDGVIHEATCYA